MPYTSVPFSDFGGLDLRSSPDNSGCIDCLNVEFDQYGAVRHRDGFADLATPADNPYTFIAPYTSSKLIASRRSSGKTDVLDSTGVVLATDTTRAAITGVRWGSPTASYFYTATTVEVRRWDGASWTTVAGAPSGTLILGVSAMDNRLIAANMGGANASKVQFSDAGDPATWGANNYLHLTPGDGEQIIAIANWGNSTFIFKESRFFHFYGNSTDSTGQPVFNYRPVEARVGPIDPFAVTVAPDGIYFVALDGIYRTTGGAPELISQALDPFFGKGHLSSYYLGGGRVNWIGSIGGGSAASPDLYGGPSLHWHQGRLYFGTGDSSVNANAHLTFVYDMTSGKWALWNVAANCYTTFNKTLIFSRGIGTTNCLGWFDEEVPWTTDAGTAITSRWRSGFYDLGIPDAEKDIARTRLWGTGSVSYTMSRDFGSLGTAQTATLGTSPAIASGMATNNPKPATLFSHQLASVSGGAWTAHRLAHELRGQRPPSAHTG